MKSTIGRVVYGRVPARPPVTRTRSALEQTSAPHGSDALAGSPPEPTNAAMTIDELIERVKHHIGVGESSRRGSFREAADKIALLRSKNVNQRAIAKAIDKSAAWVNRLLKWREGGCVGAPFADKIVQCLNKKHPGRRSPSARASQAEAGTNPSVQLEASALAVEAPTMTPLTAYAPEEHHLPAALNRQDPDRALERLVQQWLSTPLRDLFLNSPKPAQIRFLRDQIIPAVGSRETLKLLRNLEAIDDLDGNCGRDSADHSK